jgi:uncharacterized protein (DUF2236 family)
MTASSGGDKLVGLPTKAPVKPGLRSKSRSARASSGSERSHAAGYFEADSMIRRVHRERVVAFSGARALLMQAAHPLAVIGLLSHSDALDEPYERLRRTAQIMDTITFGTRSDADRLTRRVRAMHRRVSGRIPERVGPYAAGTEYRADDPGLLLWVLFSLVDSALVFYRKYVGALSREQEERFWADYRVVGRLFGLKPRDMPKTLAELDAYRERMLSGDELHVNEWARRRARQIVLEPPVPTLAWPALQSVNFVTVSLLPEEIRRQYGFNSPAPFALERALVSSGAQYTKRVLVPLLPARLRFVPSGR